MWPVLQVALDLMHAKRALVIAKESVEGGADWIEVGTPLLKSEGADCIRMLRKEFPQHKIVADTKTMDVGAFEVEIAVKAGADVITVLGLADDSTISEAALTARKYGAEVMVDLINVPDRVRRAKEAESLGASYVCMHMGIDQQMKGEAAPLQTLRDITQAISIPVAAAGGVSSETAPEMVAAGASIVIVGGAIIKDKDVTGSARRVKDSMLSGSGIPTELARRYGEEGLFEAFSKVSTPNISDAQHKAGIMRGLLPRIRHGQRMVGRALTVQTANGDWAKPVEAIDRATPGTVIVVDVGGAETAVWGELATVSAQVNGVVGLVVDGAVRDMDDIYALEFPVFSRSVAPDAGEPKGHGGIGMEVIVGGQRVRSGDWIVGDESGVIVVPKEHAVEVANRSLDVRERENRLREEIKRGSSLSKVGELEKWEQVK